MTVPDNTKPMPLLPKEPLDLPLEPLDLPAPREIPLSSDKAQNTSDTEKKSYEDELSNDNQVKTLLSWHAPGRPFRRRAKEYYINILVITLAILVILFLFSQYMLMLLVVALVFLNYALTTVAPHDFRYRITTQGITIENHFYYWDELFDFYFKTVEGTTVLYIATRYYFPGLLLITLGDMHKEQIEKILLHYLPLREVVQPSFLEKAGDWLSRTFPLDKRPT